MAVPKIVSFTATTRNILVAKHWVGYCALKYGDFPWEDGISFSAVVDVPADTFGVLEFVQDVVVFRKRMISGSGVAECLSSRGLRMLDTVDPVVPWPVGPGVHTVTAEDSPSSTLRSCEFKEVSDKFRMFLMWTDYDTPHNRVTLGKIPWVWQGRAQKSEKPGDCMMGKVAWKLAGSGQRAWPWTPGGRPVLTPNAADLRWKPC